MAKASKKKSDPDFGGKRKGKSVGTKQLTPAARHYLELLKRVEALNLPPLDTISEERHIRELEGF